MDIPKILTERPHLVGLCDQLNARITIRDLAVTDWSDERSIVWEYKHDTKGHENYGWVAGLKFRHSDYYGQDVMLFAGQPRVAYIISMKTKEILLTANEAGFNPHTSELLPDGTFIVGSSNDGRVSVYPPGKSDAAFSLQLTGADGGGTDVHGVLWDPKYDLLWVEGHQKLRSFRMEGTTEAPVLTQVGEYTFPKGGFHDMAPFYGNPDALLLSGTGGIVKFDKITETFSYDFPHCEVTAPFDCNTGFGIYADGVLALVSTRKSGAVYQYWNTDAIYVCLPGNDGGTEILKYTDPKSGWYKLRVFDFDYQ